MNRWSYKSAEAQSLEGGLKPTQCIFLFTRLFSFHGFLSEAVQTGPLCPSIYAELLCFTRHVRIQTSGIQYFTAGVKFQLLQLCLSWVWTGDITDRHRACSLTERRVCMRFKFIPHIDTEVTWAVAAQWFRPQLHRKAIIKTVNRATCINHQFYDPGDLWWQRCSCLKSAEELGRADDLPC